MFFDERRNVLLSHGPWSRWALAVDLRSAHLPVPFKGHTGSAAVSRVSLILFVSFYFFRLD